MQRRTPTDSVKEFRFPGARIRIQWHDGIGGWRWFTDAEVERDHLDQNGRVGWQIWTGDTAAVARIRIAWSRQGQIDRWFMLAGEIPSQESEVVVIVADRQRPPVAILEGRLWACEWSGVPTVAEVRIDDAQAVTVDFRSGEPRNALSGITPGRPAGSPRLQVSFKKRS